MKVHAETNRHLFAKPTAHGWDVVEVKSESNPAKKYTVDLTHGRCSCPAWIFQKPGPDGTRKPCRHLTKLGFKPVAPQPYEVAEPKAQTTESQTQTVSVKEAL